MFLLLLCCVSRVGPKIMGLGSFWSALFPPRHCQQIIYTLYINILHTVQIYIDFLICQPYKRSCSSGFKISCICGVEDVTFTQSLYYWKRRKVQTSTMSHSKMNQYLESKDPRRKRDNQGNLIDSLEKRHFCSFQVWSSRSLIVSIYLYKLYINAPKIVE